MQAGGLKAGQHDAHSEANDGAVERMLQHWGLATALAHEYRNIPKLDFDDILQHARIALNKAAMSYDAQKGIAFSTYAWRVIQNELNTLYAKQKRRLALEIYSLDQVMHDDDDAMESWKDVAEDEGPGVADIMESRERKRAMRRAVKKLPHRQQWVICGILNGSNYREIGRQLGFKQNSAKTLVARAYRHSLENLRTELKKLGFECPSTARDESPALLLE